MIKNAINVDRKLPRIIEDTAPKNVACLKRDIKIAIRVLKREVPIRDEELRKVLHKIASTLMSCVRLCSKGNVGLKEMNKLQGWYMECNSIACELSTPSEEARKRALMVLCTEGNELVKIAESVRNRIIRHDLLPSVKYLNTFTEKIDIIEKFQEQGRLDYLIVEGSGGAECVCTPDAMDYTIDRLKSIIRTDLTDTSFVKVKVICKGTKTYNKRLLLLFDSYDKIMITKHCWMKDA